MKENQHIEWKSAWRDEYLKWICGFANAGGGVLALGRNDKGNVIGLKDAPSLLVELPNKVRDLLGILVDVNLREESGVEFLEIAVEPHSNPISYRGEYYYRSGSTNQVLKGSALDRFLLRKHGSHWDGVPVPHVSISELDDKTLADFQRQALRSRRLTPEILKEPTSALLEKLHLTEGQYLKRAAILLFHPDPEQFITGAYVKLGYFENDADLRYQDEVHGSLFTQASQVIETLGAKYLKAWISYEGMQRIESWPVPETALREAILNSLVHKDYARATPVQISVYPDKLLIWNPGQLPADWNVERLMVKHASVPFNPDLANAFFRAGLIEAWGLGIEKMRRACVDAGLPAPILREETEGFWVEFTLVKTREETSGESSRETHVETTRIEATPVKTRVKTPVKTRVEISELILDLLRAKPSLSLAEVALILGKAPSTIERACAKLVANGQLRRVGPRKGGHWEVLL